MVIETTLLEFVRNLFKYYPDASGTPQDIITDLIAAEGTGRRVHLIRSDADVENAVRDLTDARLYRIAQLEQNPENLEGPMKFLFGFVDLEDAKVLELL